MADVYDSSVAIHFISLRDEEEVVVGGACTAAAVIDDGGVCGVG